MRFSFPEIEGVFETEHDKVHTIVIENRALFLRLTEDLYEQSEGGGGRAVLAREERLLDLSKWMDLTASFLPFDLNRKSLLTKITAEMEKRSQSPEHYEQTARLLSDLERYLNELAVDFPCDLEYNKLNIPAILKSAGITVCDDSADLAERMLNYMELVREFDRDKLFVTVNMRSFVPDDRMEALLETVLSHKYHLIMLENKAYPILPSEYRRTVDEDLCEF